MSIWSQTVVFGRLEKEAYDNDLTKDEFESMQGEQTEQLLADLQELNSR